MKSFLKLASMMIIACGVMLNAEGMNNQQNNTNAGTRVFMISQDFFNQNFRLNVTQDFLNQNLRPSTPMNFAFTLNLADPKPCLQQMLVLIYQMLVAANPQRTATVGSPLTEEQMRSTAVNMTNQQMERLGLNYRVQLQ